MIYQILSALLQGEELNKQFDELKKNIMNDLITELLLLQEARKQGLDVLDTKEEFWHGRDDDQLLEEAYKQGRFVLTHDSDFGTLAIHEGKKCFGIIYLSALVHKYDNIKVITNTILSSREAKCESNDSS